MQIEADIKKQMLELQYGYDMKLKSMEIQQGNQKEKDIEDRKDQRTRLEGTQQSQMITQRQNQDLPLNFFEANQKIEQDLQNENQQPMMPPGGM